jgi:hypothetical protein
VPVSRTRLFWPYSRAPVSIFINLLAIFRSFSIHKLLAHSVVVLSSVLSPPLFARFFDVIFHIGSLDVGADHRSLASTLSLPLPPPPLFSCLLLCVPLASRAQFSYGTRALLSLLLKSQPSSSPVLSPVLVLSLSLSLSPLSLSLSSVSLSSVSVSQSSMVRSLGHCSTRLLATSESASQEVQLYRVHVLYLCTCNLIPCARAHPSDPILLPVLCLLLYYKTFTTTPPLPLTTRCRGTHCYRLHARSIHSSV